MPFALQQLGRALGSQLACPETPFTLIQNPKNVGFARQISISPFMVWEPPPPFFEYWEQGMLLLTPEAKIARRLPLRPPCSQDMGM